MVDLKFVFSNIRRTGVKKALRDQVKRPVARERHEEITEPKEKATKKEILLFYSHKIRPPEYEYF